MQEGSGCPSCCPLEMAVAVVIVVVEGVGPYFGSDTM